VTQQADTSGRVFVRHKLAFPVQVDRDTLDALPSAYHIAMYVTLLRLAQAENNSAPGFKALAKQARMSVGKASAVLNELEQAGVIARTRTRTISGLDYRTNYEILGVQDVNTELHDANPVHTMNGVQDTNTGDLQGRSPHEHHVVVAQNEKEQQQAMTALVTVGVSRVVAEHLVAENLTEVQRQLAALPRRTGLRDPAATVVKAIREAWAPPAMPEHPAAAMPVVPRCDRCAMLPATTSYNDLPMCGDCADRAKADAEYDGPCRACGGEGFLTIAGAKRHRCPVGCEAALAASVS
jgi:DNA-binding Lrp family transcriptional regulator